MIKTFTALCQELGLTDTFVSEETLTKIRQWCFQHISQDVRYDGSPEEQYMNYYHDAQKYFEFLSQIPHDLNEPIPAFDNLNAIQYASSKGYDYFLAEHAIKANVNQSTPYLMTPLHIAATSGHFHTVEILLEKGADPLALNRLKEPPIFRSLFLPILHREDSIEQKKLIFNLLAIKAPDTINKITNDGDNILHLIAIHQVFANLMNLVIHKNPELPFKFNHHGLYPIHMAILNHSPEAVETLMQIPGMSEVKAPEGRYPLHFAARNKNPFMIKTCLKANPKLIDTLDRTGKTPLLLAAEVGNVAGVAALIESGANYAIKDFNDWGIADYAIHDHPKLKDWLIKHGYMATTNKPA